MDKLDLMNTWNKYRQETKDIQMRTAVPPGVNLDQCFMDGTCNEDPLNVLCCHNLCPSGEPSTENHVTFCTVKGWEQNQDHHH